MINKIEIITVDTCNYPSTIEVGIGGVKSIEDCEQDYRITFKNKEWRIYKRFIKEVIVYYG